MLSISQEETPVFDTQFSRWRGLLYFIACRVLDDRDEAEEAVQNCLLSATAHPPTFESQGAFRSWLLRILIDKALVILRQKKKARRHCLEQVFRCWPAHNSNRSAPLRTKTS
jgi:DNA-directed RNA polymerase specialized sigma24 family protein